MRYLISIFSIMFILGCSDDDIYNPPPLCPADTTIVAPIDTIYVPPVSVCQVIKINPHGKELKSYTVSRIIRMNKNEILFIDDTGKKRKVRPRYKLVGCD